MSLVDPRLEPVEEHLAYPRKDYLQLEHFQIDRRHLAEMEQLSPHRTCLLLLGEVEVLQIRRVLLQLSLLVPTQIDFHHLSWEVQLRTNHHQPSIGQEREVELR